MAYLLGAEPKLARGQEGLAADRVLSAFSLNLVVRSCFCRYRDFAAPGPYYARVPARLYDGLRGA